MNKFKICIQYDETYRATPIFKKDNKTDMNNYRPISVISAVAKIFEKAIYGQLYEYLNENSLLSNCQSGFHSLHSTLTALIEATNDWSINIDRGNLNGVVCTHVCSTSVCKFCCHKENLLIFRNIRGPWPTDSPVLPVLDHSCLLRCIHVVRSGHITL